MPSSGADITGVIASITDTSSGSGGNPSAGSGVTVALSSTTAPSSSVILGQANANLATFNFTASNDGDVKVTTVTLKRLGISADADLSAVYLYDGATRLTDSASVSSGNITFVNASGIFTVAKGTTKAITVKANMYCNGTQGACTNSGNTVGVALNAASDVTTDGAVVSGTFPMNGNLMSGANATLATVDFGASTLPASDGAPSPQDEYVMWQNNITIGNRAVNFYSLTFREIGNITFSDLANFKLYIDGIQVGATVAALDTNGYVTFDLGATPKKLETGARQFKLVGDIKGGSTRTFSFSVRQASDITVADVDYGANVLAKSNGGTFNTTNTTTASQQVAGGSMSFIKATDSPSGNVIMGASGVTLAKYTLRATGEAIKIEKLKASFVSGHTALTSLRNGKIMANGVQIGSTASLKSTVSSATFTEYTVNYTVPTGSDVTLALVADIYDDDGTNNAATTTILGRMEDMNNESNAQGQSSLSLLDTPDGADVDGNQMTITTGSLTLAKTSSYGDQTVVAPQTNYKLGSYVLTGNSSEAVNLNTFTVGVNIANNMTTAKIRNMYVKYTVGSTSSTVTPKTTVSGTNSYTVNTSIAKNANMTIEVYGDIDTVSSPASASTTLLVTGITADSSQTVYSNSNVAVAGQRIATGAGSLATAVDASSPVTAVVVGSTASRDAATFKFTATNEKFTLTELTATTTATGATVITSAMLYDGTTLLGTTPVSGQTMTFTGLSAVIDANTSKVFKVVYQLGTIGTGAGTSGSNVQTTMTGYKANNSSGVEKTQANELTTFADRMGNSIYVYKAIPTVTNVALGSATLYAGSNSIAKFSITADTNAVNWKKIEFYVAPDGVTSVSNFKLYDDTNTEVPGSFSSTTVTVAGDNAFTATNEQAVGGGSSKTYTLKADITGVGDGDSISTRIKQDYNTFATPTTYTLATSTGASFVWSDVSAVGHDTTTGDWNGDYLIKFLPTDSQGLTK